MKTIWKYELDSPNPHFDIPIGGTIVAFQVQHEKPCIWVEVNPDAGIERRIFSIVGTGHEFTTSGKYIGTVQMGPMVWHLYEIS